MNLPSPPKIKQGLFRHNGRYDPYTHSIEVNKNDREGLHHELIHSTRSIECLKAQEQPHCDNELRAFEEVIANIAVLLKYPQGTGWSKCYLKSWIKFLSSPNKIKQAKQCARQANFIVKQWEIKTK